MTKLFKYIYRIFLLIGMVATFVACQFIGEDDGTQEGNSAIIRLEVKAGEEMNTLTRAVSETTIEDMHVLVYDSNGELIGQEYQASDTKIAVTTHRANGCKVYVVANTHKPDLFKGYDIHRETYFKEMVHSLSVWSELTDGSNLPMTGSTTVDITTSTQELTMQVHRMAAKITLNIGVKAGSGITILNYKIYNVPLRSYYVLHPLATEANTDDTTAGQDAPLSADHWADSPVMTLTGGTTSVSRTFYMYENRQGVNSNIGQQSDKSSGNAPEHATYVEINGIVNSLTVSWKVYLGANNTSNFNIKRNCQYTYTITLNDKYSDTRVTINDSEVIDLSAGGTANCYLVSQKSKWYKFKATVRGNGTSTAREISPIARATSDLPAGDTMNPTEVELVWETNGHKQVIDSYILQNGYVYFKTGASVTEGNAVIAVKNTTGETLWSWHIWRTSFDLAGLNNSHTQKYKTSPKHLDGYNDISIRYMTMMDRDLGAASNIPSQTDEVVKTYGLYYQWGRKDPFPPTKIRASISYEPPGILEKDMVNIYDALGNLINPRDATHQVASINGGNEGNDITLNIDYGIKHPITFITRMENDYETGKSSLSWIYGSYNDGSITTQRWKSSILLWGGGMKDESNHNYFNSPDTKKSIYDPCPAGWCIPPQEVWSNFTKSVYMAYDASLYNCIEKINYTTPNCFLDGTVYGRQFYINDENTETAFYPALGYKHGEHGSIVSIGRYGCAWSSSIFHNASENGSSCGILGVGSSDTRTMRFGHQSDSFPARCVKESDMTR